MGNSVHHDLITSLRRVVRKWCRQLDFFLGGGGGANTLFPCPTVTVNSTELVSFICS